MGPLVTPYYPRSPVFKPRPKYTPSHPGYACVGACECSRPRRQPYIYIFSAHRANLHIFTLTHTRTHTLTYSRHTYINTYSWSDWFQLSFLFCRHVTNCKNFRIIHLSLHTLVPQSRGIRG